MIPDRVNWPRFRVALCAISTGQRRVLTHLLLEADIQVIDVDPTCSVGDAAAADVLLVDLDESADELNFDLGRLMEAVSIPILFNEAASTPALDSESASARAWGRRLIAKLARLAEREASGASTEQESASTSTSEATFLSEPQSERELARVHAEVSQLEDVIATEPERPSSIAPAAPVDSEPEAVWVLGASIGGPQAVKEFLAHLSPTLPFAYILAQHIGASFVSLLADQLERMAPIDVSCAEEGMFVQCGSLLVAPVGYQFDISAGHRVELKPADRQSIYNPSIDAVMFAVARRYGHRSRTILFSGMGTDGLLGARAIIKEGGSVWAQEPKGCVVSSMADAVRKEGLSSFNGTPTELAGRLSKSVETIQ